MSTVELFRALGEPTRLSMVERLSNGQHTISSLSKGLHITRQGARKHLQALVDAKIVRLTPDGRETNVILDRRSFEKVKKFIVKIELCWEK